MSPTSISSRVTEYYDSMTRKQGNAWRRRGETMSQKKNKDTTFSWLFIIYVITIAPPLTPPMQCEILHEGLYASHPKLKIQTVDPQKEEGPFLATQPQNEIVFCSDTTSQCNYAHNKKNSFTALCFLCSSSISFLVNDISPRGVVPEAGVWHYMNNVSGFFVLPSHSHSFPQHKQTHKYPHT